ncbi:MAG: type II toxin-antitoxin system VapC family toxin [Nitrososphaera sp.]|uniref:type II toxin-antitoxin system VapC family toxin n=1 Tax=Nitrososphaera sp. TaxID=1971748 RepID=UPI003D6F2525
MVCVDTDFLIDLSNREEKALEKLKEIREKGDTVYTTTISIGEYYTGAYRSRDREVRVAKAREFLKAFVPLTADHESARLWGQLSAELKSNTIGDLDLLIASTALSNKQVLVTRNRRHFERVPGLQVEGW